MTRRTVASLLGMGLVVAARARDGPAPGAVRDRVSRARRSTCSAKSDGKPIVQVEGHRTYPTEGELSLVTVLVTNPTVRMNLFEALVGLGQAVHGRAAPRRGVPAGHDRRGGGGAGLRRRWSTAQDTAVAAALTQMGYDLDTYAEVTGVSPAGPSEGELEPRDRFVLPRRAADRVRAAAVRRAARRRARQHPARCGAPRREAHPVRGHDRARPGRPGARDCWGSSSAPATTSRSTSRSRSTTRSAGRARAWSSHSRSTTR